MRRSGRTCFRPDLQFGCGFWRQRPICTFPIQHTGCVFCRCGLLGIGRLGLGLAHIQPARQNVRLHILKPVFATADEIQNKRKVAWPVGNDHLRIESDRFARRHVVGQCRQYRPVVRKRYLPSILEKVIAKRNLLRTRGGPGDRSRIPNSNREIHVLTGV